MIHINQFYFPYQWNLYRSPTLVQYVFNVAFVALQHEATTEKEESKILLTCQRSSIISVYITTISSNHFK